MASDDQVDKFIQAAIALAILINSAMSVVSYYRSQQLAVVVEKSSVSIGELEKNTNSKMDAMLKLQGEAEHAKGVLEQKQLDNARP
jgi:hypothetical protein